MRHGETSDGYALATVITECERLRALVGGVHEQIARHLEAMPYRMQRITGPEAAAIVRAIAPDVPVATDRDRGVGRG